MSSNTVVMIVVAVVVVLLLILGLSFAGWNAVASFFLGLIALRGAFAKA